MNAYVCAFPPIFKLKAARGLCFQAAFYAEMRMVSISSSFSALSAILHQIVVFALLLLAPVQA